MAHITGKGKRLLTEINMVPFIDVVLVLLIIFMIMSPFLAQPQLTVNLPKSVSVDAAQDDSPVKVQVSRDGSYYMRGQRVGRGDLEARLRLALRQSAGRAVLVEADKDAAFENVVFVLDLSRRVQAAKVGVGVKPPAS